MLNVKNGFARRRNIEDYFKQCIKITRNLIKETKNKIIESYRTVKLKRSLKKSRVLKLDKNVKKDEKKYFTIMIVPHSSDKVKTIKISRLYFKLAASTIVFIALLVYCSLYIYTVVNENNILKAGMDQLYAFSSQQESFLSEKIKEINSLLDKQASISSDVSDYTQRFKEIVNNYVSERINSGLASRSSTINPTTFVNDVKELNQILKALEEVNKQKEDNLTDLTEAENKLRSYLDAIPTIWPVSGRITSKFGSRLDPFTYRKAYPEGIDIAASYGTSIKASASGTVILAGYYNELGLAVIIDHGNGIKTVYGHTSKVLVKKGQTVKKGEVIARVGSSGRSTGSHLHFEIHINGKPVDPSKYLAN